jgi:hypothetical protein
MICLDMCARVFAMCSLLFLPTHILHSSCTPVVSESAHCISTCRSCLTSVPLCARMVCCAACVRRCMHGAMIIAYHSI